MASDDDLNSILESALEDFKKPQQPLPKTPASPKAVRTATPKASPSVGRPAPKPESKNELEEDVDLDPTKLLSSLLDNPELGKKFEEEMKNIFAGIGTGDQAFNFEEFQKTMEKLAELEEGLEENQASKASSGTPTPTPSPAPQQPTPPPGNQDNLSATLENLLNEAKKLNEEGGIPNLESLGDIFKGSPELSDMMETVMDKLISKDVLFEGLTELRDKLDEWIRKNAAENKITEEQRKQYQMQLESINKVLELYSENDEAPAEDLDRLMQQMENIGSLPEELLKDIGKGTEACSIM